MIRSVVAGDESSPSSSRMTYSGFGELMVAEATPEIQISAAEGQTDDHEAITSGGGTYTIANGLFTADSGAVPGGYSAVGSDDIVVYRAGQSITTEFTAMFSPPVAAGFQMAGIFGSVSGVGVGYQGTTFGFLRRIPGVRGIYRVTISNGAAAPGEVVRVTLDGVDYDITLPAAPTPAGVASAIEASSIWDGTPWRPTGARRVSPTANGATVTLLQNVPATMSGALAFARVGGGTTAGTIAAVANGAPNDDVSGFVPLASWSGVGGRLIDPTKLNVFRMVLPYLGAASITIEVKRRGRWVMCHELPYENLFTVPNQGIPVYKARYIAFIAAGTDPVWTAGASAKSQIDGKKVSHHRPGARSFGIPTPFVATATESVCLALRVRSEFGGVTCGRAVEPTHLTTDTFDNNKSGAVRAYLNPVVTGQLTWAYHDESNSVVEYARPAAGAVTVTGAPIANDTYSSGGPANINLTDLYPRLQPGDIIVITQQSNTTTANVGGGLNWGEG